MGRINYERTPKAPKRACLKRMGRLAALLGNPQDDLCIIHVAGSKGKGSTATMIAEILQASGRAVGVYSSPPPDTHRRAYRDQRPAVCARAVCRFGDQGRSRRKANGRCRTAKRCRPRPNVLRNHHGLRVVAVHRRLRKCGRNGGRSWRAIRFDQRLQSSRFRNYEYKSRSHRDSSATR